MKTFFKPSKIIFYLLSAFLYFFLGIIFAKITGAGKNQMLAGGAIVLGYGVVSGFFAFIAAIIAAQFLKNTTIVFFNKIFAIAIVLFWAFFAYRFQTRDRSLDKAPVPRRPTTAPAPLNFNLYAGEKYTPPPGLGMAVPNFYEQRVVYFYGNPNLDKPVSDHTPNDSLVFKRSEMGIEITYAPPWFVPAHLKMDYETLFIRVISVGFEFIKVVVNETNGRISYMDRSRNKLRYWPEFFLNINSVEPLYPQNNPVRVKPLSHAGIISAQYSFLKPLQISNQWMQVELLDVNLKSHGKGWIKWQENGKLLITYSLFS
ncbi:MAG: hypothetical protein ACE5GL_10930 [Calditrichia bacterium]